MGISPYPLNNRRFIGLRLTDVELDLLDQGAACLSISRSEYLRKLRFALQIVFFILSQHLLSRHQSFIPPVIKMEFRVTNVIRKQEKRSKMSANPANIFERFEARRQEDLNLRPLA